MVEQTAIRNKSEQISYSQLPLAVYCEIAAHLRQVEGITVNLVSQTDREFDYNQSQIGSLYITYSPDLDADSLSRIRKILDYYAERFGGYSILAINDI